VTGDSIEIMVFQFCFFFVEWKKEEKLISNLIGLGEDFTF